MPPLRQGPRWFPGARPPGRPGRRTMAWRRGRGRGTAASPGAEPGRGNGRPGCSPGTLRGPPPIATESRPPGKRDRLWFGGLGRRPRPARNRRRTASSPTPGSHQPRRWHQRPRRRTCRSGLPGSVALAHPGDGSAWVGAPMNPFQTCRYKVVAKYSTISATASYEMPTRGSPTSTSRDDSQIDDALSTLAGPVDDLDDALADRLKRSDSREIVQGITAAICIEELTRATVTKTKMDAGIRSAIDAERVRGDWQVLCRHYAGGKHARILDHGVRQLAKLNPEQADEVIYAIRRGCCSAFQVEPAGLNRQQSSCCRSSWLVAP